MRISNTKLIFLTCLSLFMEPNSIKAVESDLTPKTLTIEFAANSAEDLDRNISQMKAAVNKNITKFASSSGILPEISISGSLCSACLCPCFIPCIAEGCLCEIFSTPGARLNRRKYIIRAQLTEIRQTILGFPTSFPETYHELYMKNIEAYNSLISSHSKTKSGGMKCVKKSLFSDSADVKDFLIVASP